MDPDQTADLDLHYLLKRLENVSADNNKHKIFVICAISEVSVYTVMTFMKCTHVCAAQKAYKLLIKPEVSSIM